MEPDQSIPAREQHWAHESIVAAVHWWHDALIEGRINRVGAFGDRKADTASILGIFAGVTGRGARPAAAQAFAAGLYKHIASFFDRVGPKYDCTLAVDYGPEYQLAEVARKAGLVGGSWPQKTRMNVYVDHVVVAAGYHAPDVVLYDRFREDVLVAWRAHQTCPKCNAPWREKHFATLGDLGDEPKSIRAYPNFAANCYHAHELVGRDAKVKAWATPLWRPEAAHAVEASDGT